MGISFIIYTTMWSGDSKLFESSRAFFIPFQIKSLPSDVPEYEDYDEYDELVNDGNNEALQSHGWTSGRSCWLYVFPDGKLGHCSPVDGLPNILIGIALSLLLLAQASRLLYRLYKRKFTHNYSSANPFPLYSHLKITPQSHPQISFVLLPEVISRSQNKTTVQSPRTEIHCSFPRL